MAYTLALDLSGGSAANKVAASAGTPATWVRKVCDFATNNVSSGAIVGVLRLPKHSVLHGAILRVVTAEGGTATVDLGIHSADVSGSAVDIDGILDGVDINAAAGTGYYGQQVTPIAGTAVTDNVKLLMQADNLLTLTVNNDLDTAIIEIAALISCPFQDYIYDVHSDDV